MKTDFQASLSPLMVLMPISPILVLRAVQKARTLISQLPCKPTSSSSLYLADQQLPLHRQPGRFMGKPPNIRICRRRIPRWDSLRYQGLRIRWMWRRCARLESCRSAYWENLLGYRQRQLPIRRSRSNGHLRRDRAVLCYPWCQGSRDYRLRLLPGQLNGRRRAGTEEEGKTYGITSH